MSKIKEFEELDSATEYAYEYCVNRNNSNNSHEFKIHMYEAIERAKKDAWNAAIKCAAEACEFYCDKQLVLTQLVNGD